jgi:hypothetical protein
MRTPAKNSQPFAQLNLVHEDITDVAHSLVAALGGAKIVGPRLFPKKTPEAAARILLDCLNPNRDHDIGAEGLVTLLRWAREQGVHLGFAWLCEELSYASPQPIEPEDVRAELQQRFLTGVEELKQLAKRLER